MEDELILEDVIVRTMNNTTMIFKNVIAVENDNTLEIYKYRGQENEERWVYPMINIMYYTITEAGSDHTEH